MQTKIIETEHKNGAFNWGKFLVGRFDHEWERRPMVSDAQLSARPLLSAVGWTPQHILVLDLQTGEGCVLQPGGSASADLEKHKVWVCPMFEPFLKWLYQQDLSDLSALPDLVTLTWEEAPPAFAGYRREGGIG